MSSRHRLNEAEGKAKRATRSVSKFKSNLKTIYKQEKYDEALIMRGYFFIKISVISEHDNKCGLYKAFRHLMVPMMSLKNIL